MQDFRNLKVWQKAHELTLLVYKATADFPRDELFGLRTSIRKTCIDIPAHIADGAGKLSSHEFSRSVGAAMGAASRLEYLVLLSSDLGLLGEGSNAEIYRLLTEVRKMLNVFGRRLFADKAND